MPSANFDFSGSVAIVTGGANGIGRAICVALGERGAKVAINFHSREDAARETAEHLNAQGERVGVLQIRLFRPFSARHFLDALPVSVRRIAVLDRSLGWAMVHAGLAPDWTLDAAAAHAAEVERELRGPGHRKLLRQMYGNKPNWSPKLRGPERMRAIINVLTRMRYCTPRGRIAFDEKGAPGTQAPGLYPWYSVPGRAERDLKIVCGHWSSLGLFIGHGVHGLDTGAVWGGMLTALQIDSEELRVVQVPGQDAPRK